MERHAAMHLRRRSLEELAGACPRLAIEPLVAALSFRSPHGGSIAIDGLGDEAEPFVPSPWDRLNKPRRKPGVTAASGLTDMLGLSKLPRTVYVAAKTPPPRSGLKSFPTSGMLPSRLLKK